MTGLELVELRVVGIDPGPVPGLVELRFHEGQLTGVEVAQTSATLAPCLLMAVLERLPVRTIVAVEKFVVVRGSMKSAGAGATTRDLVGQLAGVVTNHGASAPHVVQYAQRSASEVKPWATDARLEAAGLTAMCKGMRHARDAARHAAFAAVKDGGLSDPLSARGWLST